MLYTKGHGKSVRKGDIIRIPWLTYVDYPGGKWREHFVEVGKLFLVKDIPNNNGRFTAIDSHGRRYTMLYELMVTEIVKRRA